MSLLLAPEASCRRSTSSGEAEVLVVFDDSNGANADRPTKSDGMLQANTSMSASALNVLVLPAFSCLTGAGFVVRRI